MDPANRGGHRPLQPTAADHSLRQRPCRTRARLTRRSRRLVTGALTCTLLTGTAACGQDSAAPGASGDPIVVMTWAPLGGERVDRSGMPALAQAFADDLNAKGGVNGRPLKVLVCDEGDDPVKAAGCADRAVRENVVAVVGSYTEHGSHVMPGLEGAGIPFIGGYGASDEEFSSPVSYPVNGGDPTLLAGNGRQLADSACRRVALVRPDNAAGDLLSGFLAAGLGAERRRSAADIRAPEDATDYTTQAARAVGEDLPGSCVTAVLSERTETFLDSYRRIRTRNTSLASVLGSVSQSLVAATGGAESPLEGVYATGWYPPESDPRWDRMRKVVERYAFDDEQIDTGDPAEQTTWVAYTVFAAVARTLEAPEVSADTLRRALDRQTGVSTDGLTPPLSWRFENMLSLMAHPRLVNTSVTYQVVRGGELVAVRDGFVDVRGLLERYEKSSAAR